MDDTVIQSPGYDRAMGRGGAQQRPGWSDLARQHPVFSCPWYACRVRSFLAPLALLALALGAIAAFARPGLDASGVYLALGVVWMVVAFAVFAGRGLAVLVCRQEWTARGEALGVTCMLLLGFVLALSLTPFTDIAQPSAPTLIAAAQECERARENRVLRLAVWSLVLAWLGGGADLVTYFRQRGTGAT